MAKDSREEVGWIELVLGTGSFDCTGSFDNRGRPDGRFDRGGCSSILFYEHSGCMKTLGVLPDGRNASAQITVFGWCHTIYTKVGWPARIGARFDEASNAQGASAG